jgi:hypothetical protein
MKVSEMMRKGSSKRRIRTAQNKNVYMEIQDYFENVHESMVEECHVKDPHPKCPHIEKLDEKVDAVSSMFYKAQQAWIKVYKEYKQNPEYKGTDTAAAMEELAVYLGITD